jgi:hypothetical protein
MIRYKAGVECIIEKAREQRLRWAGKYIYMEKRGKDPMRAEYDLPVPGKKGSGQTTTKMERYGRKRHGNKGADKTGRQG